MRKILLLATCLLASGVALLAQTPAPQSAAGQHRVIQRVLVRVNGEVFTQTQLEHQQIPGSARCSTR